MAMSDISRIIMDDEGQENCLGSAWAGPENVQEGSLDAKITVVKHLASRISLARRDTNEFSSLIASVETSLGGLRQEVHAVKQLGSHRGGPGSQQQQQASFHATAAGELLDPLHGLPARLSAPPIRRNTLACSETSASRRSSLGLRMQQQAWDAGSLMGTVSEGYGNVEERIYAGIASALKAAAAQHTPAKASAASRHVASPRGIGSPLQQAMPGELATAAAADALSAQCQEAPTAGAVAAAMQELAAASATAHLGQQLQQQVQQLEQDVEGLRDNVATHLSSSKAQETQLQQLQERQSRAQQDHAQEQQRLAQEAGTCQEQLLQQQELVAALTAEVQEVRQQQQQRPSTAVMQELLAELRVEAQLQTAQLGKQQEERLSLMLGDIREELLDRLDGLQLRLQSVEEEQERIGERQQQQSKERTAEAAAAAAGAPARQASCGRQRVCAGPGHAAAAPSQSESGVMGALLPGFALPDVASMIPTSISEPEAQHSRYSSIHAGPSSILEQQTPRQQPSTGMRGEALPAGYERSGLELSALLSESQDCRSQLLSDVADLIERVRLLEQQQGQAEGVSSRLQTLEDQMGDAAPLDGMTCGAFEARLSVLEDDSNEAKQQLQAARRQLAEVRVQLESLQQQPGGDSSGVQGAATEQQHERSSDAADAELAAHIASLEAQQQELRELAQRLEAAQQQLATADGFSVSLDSQPSSVRDRIQQFEEQLNAAIRRFAPGQLGSRATSDGSAPGTASDPGNKNPGREASLRELLANLQADLEQLQFSAAAGDSSDASCSASGLSGSAATPEDAGCVQAGQLQQQLAKLTQNCAELGEAVLQLDLQMQQVEDRVKQQRHQSLAATQSATAATYISKEAAHEIERVLVQVQQLAAAVNGPSSSKDALVAVDGASDADRASCPADTDAQQAQTGNGSVLAEKLQQLEESVLLLRQQVQDGAQQLQEHAAAQERHAAAARQLAQHLADHQQQAASASAHQQQLDGLAAAQREYEQQQQQRRSDAEEQLAQVCQKWDEQQAALEGLREQGQQQHAALMTQLQESSQGLSNLRQQLEAQIGSCASAALLQQLQEQLGQLQQRLEQLAEAEARQQLEQHASFGAVEARLSVLEGAGDPAEVQAQLSKVQNQLSQHAAQADEQSGLLFSLRVDLQNGLQELGERLMGVEGLREDMSICEDSRKAAAARTEAAAAEALEKVEAMMASFAEQHTQQIQQAQLAAESSGASVRAESEALQQQLQSLTEQLAGLQQNVAAAKQELTAEWQGTHATAAEQNQAVQQRLNQCCQQLHDLQDQQQQMQPQAEQLREQLEQKVGAVEADLRTQLVSHSDELQQHASTSQQVRDQAARCEGAIAELRARLDSQQAGWDSCLPAVQEQVEQLRGHLQQQREVPSQLEQLQQQLQELQDSSAAHASSQQACSAQISSLQQQLREVQLQALGSEGKLQEAQANQQRLQEQLAVLKADQAEQLVKGLQPLQEEQAVLNKRVQDHEAAAAAHQQQLLQWEQQLQGLLARVAEVQTQQARQQEEALPAAEQQAQQLQQLQVELAELLQQQQESAAMMEERRQLEQQCARDLHQTLNDQLQEHAGQFAGLQQQLAELSCATKRLQEQVQEQPDLVRVEQLQQQLQGLSGQLQNLDTAVHDQQQATSSSAALQAWQLQQHQERLDKLPQQLEDLQRCQGQHTSQLQALTTHRDDHQSRLQAVQAKLRQVSGKLVGLAKQQSQQQDIVSDLRQQQDQGGQLLQQLQVRVDALEPSISQAAADAAAAVSSASDAEKQVRELREDLEEALGFMAPFMSSPAASSLISPGGTPFVSPHRHRALACTGLPPDGFPTISSFGPQSPLCAPTYSINPLGAAMPGGYSVTIDIGTQLPARPLAMLPGQQQLALQSSSPHAPHQPQQQGLLEAPGSAAASRRVSLQESAVSLPAAYLPLSAGLWRPEPHQVAAASAGEQADAQPAGAAAAGTPAAGPAAVGLSRFEVQVTPGSSAARLTRSASLDSPSFTAAAVAGVSYDPTPPSEPSTGSRPFRGQLAGSPGARQDGAGACESPAHAGGSATCTGGSSASRLLRTLSLDSPSFIAAATAGLAYDLTPGRSASAAAQQAEAGSASRLAMSVDASGAALRLFDRLGEAAGCAAAGSTGCLVTPSQLAGPEEDDSPEHHHTQQHRLPGGVVASALLRSGSNLQRVSHSTAEGIGSQRSSAVWSCRDSAVFDNSLYNTPKKRRKSRAADAGSTLGGAASVGAPGSCDDGGGSDAASDSGSSSHGGLVSLTDSLTALQLQRLQQQAGTLLGARVAAVAGSLPVTPTGTVGGAFDGSSPATTATPVSVYSNAVYEANATGQVLQQLPAAAFASGGAQVAASRALQPDSPAAASAVTPTAAAAAAGGSTSSGYATPGPAAPQAPVLAPESSAEDAAAAAMSAGRSLSPAEAVATVRSLAASATTPPSLGSWQKKWQKQQRQQQYGEQGLSGTPEHAAEQQQQQGGSAEAVPGSCDLDAGPAAAEGDSPAMLPPASSRHQHQPTPGLGVGRSITLAAVGGCEAVAGLQQEQPAAALSAELLQQHTRQQQQEHGGNRQLPWLQQQQQASPGARAGPLPSPAAWSDPAAATPREHQLQQALSAQGTPEAVLSPMMSELVSLGADVIDLDGSEADSDLLAATPDRSCSKTGPAAPGAVAAGAFAAVSKQLLFDELAVGDAATPSVQQQQQQALAGTCTNSKPTSVQAAEPAAASTNSMAEEEQKQEPVLRLKGGGGYEPHQAADLAGVGEGAAAWQLSREDSFDLADYDSSDGEGGSGSDSYWEAWELVQAPGWCSTAAATAAAATAVAGQGKTTPGSSGPAGLPSAATVAAVPGSGAASRSSAGAAAQPAARRTPAPVPQGWLRALPPDWQVGAAPADAYRVALRTSSKAGAGTKTRATVLITGMTGSICCEHKLGGGRKRCSYPPSSTVQDWLLLQHTAARSSGSNSNAAPASQRHAPGVSVVTVSHDAAGFSGAWLLDCVIVQHLSSGAWWQFDNRAGWIKGTQQAKAVAAARGAAEQESEGAAQEGDSSAAKPLPEQLQLSASGIAANCPLEAMPRSSSSSSGRVTQQGKQAGMPPQPQQVQPPAPASDANCSSTAPSTRADSAAAYGAGDDASTVSKGDAGLCAAPGGFVPLDDVELKLRGSLRGIRSRSCSPSPTHRAQQQQQQQRTGQDRAEAARSVASAAAVAVIEAAGLRSIAAVVSRAAAPAAAATAAAWDALGASRRSSAGELRHPTAARRVSGSVAPAKLVPLQAGGSSSSSSSSRSSSGGGGSEGYKLAALQAREKDAEAAGGAAPAEGCCSVSRTLTHSSDGTPCRLVRCNSSYLGRTSSSSARQLQEQGGQQRGVHFQGWAEQVVFDPAAMQGRRIGSIGTSSSSSIQSFTEEQLLEAQGGWEFVRPPDASSSYTTLIDSQMAGAAAAPAGRGQAGAVAVAAASSGPLASTPASGAIGGSGELQEVSLIETKPVSLLNKARGGGCEYQLRLHTADKVGAALPAGQQVFVEVLGSTGSLLTTQLPRPKGSFLRGCCDAFSLASAAGDIGRVEAVRVWHEPGGGSIGGSWCLHRLDVEAVFTGVTYALAKSPSECWIGKGAERAVVLNQPRLLRSGDESALLAEAAELQQQLDANVSLEAADRAVLTARLQNLQLRLTA